ncbi:MAG: HAD-superfamily hydrolase, subfamily variant 3 [Frankiales bacterium]|nr:HAD-superfamily hydrolase, subfamily variant 3 [Frankiales bacterium]
MTQLIGRVVLFDCDGVLVDSDGAVIAAWSRWAEEHGLTAADVMAVVHGRRSADTVARFIGEAERETALALIDRYELEAAQSVEPLPGARDLLLSCPRGAWAVVTSGRRELALARLAATGLPIPDVIVTADDVRQGKPDPEGYLAAAARLGASAGEAIVVEDSPDGIGAARAALVKAVLGVGERARGASPDALVQDLRAVSWNAHGLSVQD